MAINVSDLAESGASSGEAGIWGMVLAGYQMGYRLEQQQLRCQTGVALPCESRDHSPVLTAVGIAPNERDLDEGERRSGILCQALFSVTYR
jgi:hypothetical protein